MYNVLEKLRAEQALTDKEKTIHQQGQVSILRELHDDLDRAVFAAYGWNDLEDKLVGLPGATTPLPDKPAAQAEAEEELLSRLVALNHQRAAEEARSKIRWLRPEYQAPEVQQDDIALDDTSPRQKPLPANPPGQKISANRSARCSSYSPHNRKPAQTSPLSSSASPSNRSNSSSRHSMPWVKSVRKTACGWFN
jgi:hypothetical protein